MLSYNAIAQIIRRCITEDFVGALSADIAGNSTYNALSKYWSILDTTNVNDLNTGPFQHMIAPSTQLQITNDKQIYFPTIATAVTEIYADQKVALTKTNQYSVDELYNILVAVFMGKVAISNAHSDVTNFIQTTVANDLRYAYPYCPLRRSMAQNRYVGAIGGGYYRWFMRTTKDIETKSPLIHFTLPSAWLDGINIVSMLRLSMDNSNVVPKTLIETAIDPRTHQTTILGTQEHDLAYVFEIVYRTMNVQVLGRANRNTPLPPAGDLCISVGMFSVWSVLNTIIDNENAPSNTNTRVNFTTPMNILMNKGAIPHWWFLGNAYLSGSIQNLASNVLNDISLPRIMNTSKNVISSFREYGLHTTNPDAYVPTKSNVDINTIFRYDRTCVADDQLNMYSLYGPLTFPKVTDNSNSIDWKLVRRTDGEGVGDFYVHTISLPETLYLSDIENVFVKNSPLGRPRQQNNQQQQSNDIINRSNKRIRYDLGNVFEVC